MAQLELHHLKGNSWYIPAPANIGLYVKEGTVTLIDTGNDKEAGRQINKLIEGQGWNLSLIINTHSNADHIGGNAFLQNKTGCAVAATRREAPFIEYPELESSFLYGGYPMKAMQNKFLMAKPSKVTHLIDEDGPVLDTGLEAIPLPGHFFGMIGIRTPDNILFIADSLFPVEIIRKYHVFFLYDIASQFETLNRLESEKADLFIPGHGSPTESLTSLILENRRKIEEILTLLETVCSEFTDFDTVLKTTVNCLELTMDPNQYILIGSALRSYLAYLERSERMVYETGNNTLQWKRKAE